MENLTSDGELKEREVLRVWFNQSSALETVEETEGGGGELNKKLKFN